MVERRYFLLKRPPSQPAPKVPTTLNSPISASAVMPCAGLRPESLTDAGRCAGRRPAVGGAQAGVADVRRQVHREHGDMEAAHEVAPEQQVEALLAHRLAQ